MERKHLMKMGLGIFFIASGIWAYGQLIVPYAPLPLLKSFKILDVLLSTMSKGGIFIWIEWFAPILVVSVGVALLFKRFNAKAGICGVLTFIMLFVGPYHVSGIVRKIVNVPVENIEVIVLSEKEYPARTSSPRSYSDNLYVAKIVYVEAEDKEDNFEENLARLVEKAKEVGAEVLIIQEAYYKAGKFLPPNAYGRRMIGYAAVYVEDK